MDIPLGAQVSCTTSADCPNNFICRTELGRCARPGEAEPPEIVPGSVQIIPAPNSVTGEVVVSATTQVQLSFDVTEPLGVLPVVVVGSALRPQLILMAQVGQHYEFWWTPGPNEADGIRSILATLVDQVGNTSPDVTVTTLRVDTTPPKLVQDAIRYVPGPSNPLQAPRALTDGSRADVTLYVDEPLGAPPTLSVVCNAEALVVTPMPTSSSTAFSFSVATSGTELVTDATCTLSTTATDLAGNEGTFLLASTLILDRSRPPSSVIDIDALAHVRIPWGTSTTESAEQYVVARDALDVEVPAGVSPFDTVIPRDVVGQSTETIAQIRVYTDDTARSFLGNVDAPTTPGDLWPSILLSVVDSVGVAITAVDSAGNESLPEPVSRVVWIATVRGKQIGDDIKNPNHFETTGQFSQTFVQPGATPHGHDERLNAADNSTITTETQLSWLRTKDPESPPAAKEIQAAFDTRRGVVMLVAPSVTGGDATSVWELRNDSWEEVMATDPELDGNPGPVSKYALAHDPVRGVTVLFGGSASPTQHGRTWEWTGTSWSRRCDGVPATDVCPEPVERQRHAMAYDVVSGRVLLFGGSSDNGCAPGGAPSQCGDTWGWDGTTWTHLTPSVPTANNTPTPRDSPAMAPDGAGHVVLFGGACGYVLCQDTWLWDGAQWVQATVNPLPSGRKYHMMASTTVPGEVVLYGGGPQADATNDTLLWNTAASTWTDVGMAPAPPDRRFAAMALDSLRGRVISFGGELEPFNGDTERDTWAWDVDTRLWSQIIPRAGATPPARSDYRLVYDSLREVLVLFGGKTFDPTRYHHETWEYDGAWSNVTPPTDPGVREGQGMVFDDVRNTTVMFGGRASLTYLNDTRTYNGANWINPCGGAVCTPSPQQRSFVAMEFHGLAEHAVLFGGSVDGGVRVGDTWTWNGSNWTERCVGSEDCGSLPAPRTAAEMVYDPVRQRVIMFGGLRESSGPTCSFDGGPACDDTWEWTGSSWHGVSVLDPEGDGNPEGRTSHSMAYSNTLGGVVLFGGGAGGTDLWLYDGVSWAKLLTTDVEGDGSPAITSKAAMAYYPPEDRLMLVGGSAVLVGKNRWWSLRRPPESFPAHILTASFGRANGPRALACRSSSLPCAIANIRVRWWGEARGSDTPAVVLAAWRNGAWSPIASATELSGLTQVDTIVSTEAYRLFSGSEDQLAIAVYPQMPNGSGAEPAFVSTDYFEIWVEYQRL